MTQADSTFEVEIPIKINLHQFVMLSAIHYLPSFCGRWELKLYFDANNLVICPVNPLAYTDSQVHPIITKTNTFQKRMNGKDSVIDSHKLEIHFMPLLMRDKIIPEMKYLEIIVSH